MVVLICANFIHSGTFFPGADTKHLWFYSGLFMVLFSVLFIDPFYTSPKNVITNVMPLLLVFLAIKPSFQNQMVWWVTITVLFILIIISTLAMVLEDKEKSSDCARNKFSKLMKNIAVTIERGKTLYSAIFFYFLLTYHSVQDFYTLFLFLLWAAFLMIDPKKLIGSFALKSEKKLTNQIGEIFGIQSKKVFLVKLYGDKKGIKKFDIVNFRYSMQDYDDIILKGIVFDTYLLNQEKWAKVLQLSDSKEVDYQLEKNVVYKVTDKNQVLSSSKELSLDRFAGVVIDGSVIGKIKFEYSKKTDDLQEGDLLELKIGTKRLFYQVVAGSTEKEKLEARNETGFIEGDAIQLGEWKNDKNSFQKFGWVPPINTPLFKADTSDISVGEHLYPNYKLGSCHKIT